MHLSTSAFIRTEIPVWENAIKSLIFRLAELLLAFAIWRAFSLLAAAQNRFTSYLVFAEPLLQKAYFVWSRGFISKDALLVGAFSIIYAAVQLYGTLLWALDAPGHIVQAQLANASSISASVLGNPAFVIDYTVTPSSLTTTNADLASALSVNLFRQDANISLTGSFDQGAPETALASSTRPQELPAGPRIWLDDKGWSVSTDMVFHTAAHYGAVDTLNRSLGCPFADIDQPDLMQGFESVRYYNCTFDNEWTPDLIARPVGTPSVYWIESAEVDDYIVGTIPPRRHDAWSFEGAGSGTNIRFHMFTVRKGYRRHTFLSTVAKSSVGAMGARPVPQDEMEELMRRFVPIVPEVDRKEEEAGFHMIAEMFTGVQAINKSAAVGIIRADKHHILESFFEILSFDFVPGETLSSMFRITSVNITLLKSETVSSPPPVPLDACRGAYQNNALGGKVISTTCPQRPRHHDADPIDFGQVDTSAVLHLDGFDRSASLTSAEAAINPLLWAWVFNNTDTLSRLVLSRGYLLGLDPELVTVQIAAAVPGISYLQLLMVLLALVLAGLSWIGLWLLASGHWTSSFLVNLLTTTCTGFSSRGGGVPVLCRYPDIHLEKDSEGGTVKMKTDTGVFAHLDGANTAKVQRI